MDGDEDGMAAKRTAGRTAWDTTSTDDRQPLQVRIESGKVVVKRRTRAFDFDKILRLSVRDAQILASQLLHRAERLATKEEEELQGVLGS